jgi:hypothetical protein
MSLCLRRESRPYGTSRRDLSTPRFSRTTWPSRQHSMALQISPTRGPPTRHAGHLIAQLRLRACGGLRPLPRRTGALNNHREPGASGDTTSGAADPLPNRGRSSRGAQQQRARRLPAAGNRPGGGLAQRILERPMQAPSRRTAPGGPKLAYQACIARREQTRRASKPSARGGGPDGAVARTGSRWTGLSLAMGTAPGHRPG